MSATYVRTYYAVDYKVGDRLLVDGRPGVLVSFPSHYLGVRFDGEKHNVALPPHVARGARSGRRPLPVTRPRAPSRARSAARVVDPSPGPARAALNFTDRQEQDMDPGTGRIFPSVELARETATTERNR
jgi:hypothetical protein